MMKDYVEKILHQDVQISPYTDMGRLLFRTEAATI